MPPPYVRPANGWPCGIVVTFTPPDPYAVDVVLPLPNVVPETGTADPRLPAGTEALPLAPLEPLLPPLPALWPPPWPPPPLGWGTGLRGRRGLLQCSVQDESVRGEEKGVGILEEG